MTAGTPQEQLMLELTNRARMNPAAEAARLNVALDPGQGSPKPILAMNNRLQVASDRHGNWMLINDQFNHQESTAFPNGRTGLEPGDRMRAAGYTFTGNWTWGENIAWSGTTGTLNATAAIYGHHEALFRSDGHRANTLNAVFREAGIGQQIGDYRGYHASMLTENFARSGTTLFVSGALFNDTDRDFFYDVGEQVAGRSVTATGVSDRGRRRLCAQLQHDRLEDDQLRNAFGDHISKCQRGQHQFED